MSPRNATPGSRAFEVGLSFLVNSMKRRFPDVAGDEIEEIVAEAVREIAPSKDRTRLQREVLRRLKGIAP